MSIVAPNDFQLILLVMTLGLSVIVCGLMLYALLRNRFPGRLYGSLVCGLFGVALVLLSVEALSQFDARFVGIAKSLSQLSCLACLSISILLMGRVGISWRTLQQARQSSGVWGIFMVSVVMCWVCSTRMHAAAKLDPTLSSAPELPGEVKPIDTHIGYTDRGRAIELYYFEVRGEIPRAASSGSAAINSYPAALIQRKEIDVSANCHGWVFADGIHLINSSGVSMILEDNGYIRVDRPKAGDVAVYRSSNGNIVHSAIVCSVLPDNMILLESKWGVHQRFIHLPENQPYSTLIEYYSTERSNHTINIVEKDESIDTQMGNKMGG